MFARLTTGNTSSFDAPEIVVRLKKHHHAGLIVRSPEAARVAQLLDEYSVAFAEKFMAKMPPPPKPTS